MTGTHPSVILIGCGALGSNLVLAARNVPASWTVVDHDRVEARNVLSQFHPRASVGANKALAMRAALRQFFGLEMTAVPYRLSESNTEAILGCAGIAVDCTDDAATTRLILSVARCPVLVAKVSAGASLGVVRWSNVAGHPDYEPDERPEGAATCEAGHEAPELLAVATYAALALRAAVEDGVYRAYNVTPLRAAMTG